MTNTVISCQNVWKLFGPDPKGYFESLTRNVDYDELKSAGYIGAVRDVSIEIDESEILVIMGLSGSGKSTLVRCLSRLIDITAGSVWVEGLELGKLTARELIDLRRKKMGMVFQNFGLLPHRSVLENVAFPLEMRGQDRNDRRKRALEMIELVGLSGREDYFPRELSGGQQQRVGIARSLVIEPDIWFLDEPFSALDPLIRREMQDEFQRLQEMLGKTIVFITHDFDEAIRLADRIAIMKDGVVEQCDTPDRIVIEPSTEYVAKFTKDVNKAQVVHVQSLIHKLNDKQVSGTPVPAKSTILELARQFVGDEREWVPVKDDSENIIGVINRTEALNILFGDEE